MGRWGSWGKWRLWALEALAAYWSFLPLAKVFPVLQLSALPMLHFLSMYLVALALATAAIWTAGAWVVSRVDNTLFRPVYRDLLTVAVAGLAMGPAAFGLTRVLPDVLPAGSDQLKFNLDVWISPHAMEAKPHEFSPRQKMLADVVDHVLPGRNRAEIEQLLGKSLETPYFTSTNRDMIYVLGDERRYFSLDSEWLLIWLDSSGQFQRYKIVND